MLVELWILVFSDLDRFVPLTLREFVTLIQESNRHVTSASFTVDVTFHFFQVTQSAERGDKNLSRFCGGDSVVFRGFFT